MGEPQEQMYAELGTTREAFRELDLKEVRANRSCSLAALRIPGWEDSQAYRKKNPPWFKLYRHNILDSYDFTQLTVKRRFLVIGLQALATEVDRDNEVPLDLKWLSRRLSTKFTIADLEALEVSGLVQICPPSDPGADETLPGSDPDADHERTGSDHGNTRGYGTRSHNSSPPSNSGSEGMGVSEPQSPPVMADEIPF